MPARIWTIEKVTAIAKSCESRKEFYTGYRRAYDAASREGWLSDLAFGKDRESWTFDKLGEIVKGYSTRIEFKLACPKGHCAAKNHDWLDDLFASHKNHGYLHRPRGYWTKARITEEAKKFKYRHDFQRASKSAYSAAQQLGCLDVVCRHMARIGNLHKRAIYSIRDAEQKAIYIGLSQNPKQRYAQHRDSGKKAVRELISGPHEFRVHGSFLPEDEASEREDSLIQWYRRRGWDVLNKYRGGGLGGNVIKWTKATIVDGAKNHQTREEFRNAENGAYQVALKRGWLDFAFRDHPHQGFASDRQKNGYWTFDRCAGVVARCGDRAEFTKKYTTAYSIASKKGWLDRLFKSHSNRGFMHTARGSVTFEDCQRMANSCDNRGQFQAEHRAAYDRARTQGWLDRLFENHRYRGYRSETRMNQYLGKKAGR